MKGQSQELCGHGQDVVLFHNIFHHGQGWGKGTLSCFLEVGGVPFPWSKYGEQQVKNNGLKSPGTSAHCLGATPDLVKQ